MSLPASPSTSRCWSAAASSRGRRDAQFRPCHLEAGALDGALDWITTNRRLWDERFDKLDALLADLQPAEKRDGPRAVAEHGELHFSRVFDAPRALVFACMTDADHLTHFWGPAGVQRATGPHHRRCPARRRLRDRHGQRGRRERVPDPGRYDEVRPPELLVWTESHPGMRVRSEFLALGPDRTEVRIHQTYVPEAFSAPEAQAGSCPRSTASTAYLAGLVRVSTGPPGHRRRVRRTGRPVGRRRARRVGRTVTVRGLAHPRGGGPRDDAGALRRPRFHGGAGVRRR